MSDNDPAGPGPGEDEDVEKLPNPNISVMSSPSSQVAEMDDLNERFSQQQVMISHLKEMVIAEEAARSQKIASSRLKMEKCVSQLARIRDRAKVTKLKNAPSSSAALSEPVSMSPEAINVPLSSEASDVTTPTSCTELNPAISTASPTVLSVPQKSTEIGTKSKTPSREVTKMLYQQIKEHKAMIAERAKNEKDLEVALAKIQKQLEESQNQSAEALQVAQSKTKISMPALSLEETIESNKIIHELRSKITFLEGNILDLQETCKEKDSVIDSKTKAITLMSADLSKKGKNTLDLLDDTKEQMHKMQENFASMENKMKIEKREIMDELEVSKNRVIYLEEANTILETERFNLSVHNNQLEEQLAAKECEITEMKLNLAENLRHIEELSTKVKSVQSDAASSEEKGTREISGMNVLSEKIEILEKLNCVLRQSNIDLQEKINPSAIQGKEQSLSPSKQVKEDSPKTTKKGKATPKPKGAQKSKNVPKTDTLSKPAEVKEPNKELQDMIHNLEIVIQTLNKQVLEKEILLTKKETECVELKEMIANSSVDETIDNSSIVDKTPIENPVEEQINLDHNVVPSSPVLEESLSVVALEDSQKTESLNASQKESIDRQLEVASKEIIKLTKELAESNKNMLKVKVSHKAKIKQMQKSIDDFSKVSDSNSEMVHLQSEVAVLTQKIAELEEEKGNLQLHLVDYDSGRVSDSQLHAKLMETENIAEERLKAIADLETQKFDMVQELHSLNQQISGLEDKVSDLIYFENEHVSAELKSAQLEEQLDMFTNKNKQLQLEVEDLKVQKTELLGNIEELNKEKVEMNNKLECYIQENMDLIDKLDKLSAEKVSSAESIEMVESLTTQEKMEIEQYEQSLDSDKKESLSHSNIPENLIRRDSSIKLCAESSELQAKIDLFTQERHEVMEKLEILKNENISLSSRLEELLREKDSLEENYEVLKIKTQNITEALRSEEDKNISFNSSIDELKQENRALLEQIKKLFSDDSIKSVPTAIDKETEEITESAVVPPVEIQESTAQLESSDKHKTSTKDSKKLTKEILRLKNVIKQKETEIHNLSSQIVELQSAPTSNETLQKEQNTFDELQNALKDNEILSEELLSVKKEKELFNERLVILQDNLNAIKKDKGALSKLMEEKVSILKSTDFKLKDKDEELNLLNFNNEQLKITIDSFSEIIENKDKEIGECKKLINQLESASKKLEFTVTQFKQEQSSSSHQAGSIKQLDNKIVEMQSIILENENKIKELQLELVQSNNSEELLRQQLLAHQSEINDLKNTLNINQKEMRDVINEKEDKNAEILRLHNECSSKDEEIHEIKLQLRKESIEYDKMKNNLKDIEDNRDGLQVQVNQLQESCTAYKANEAKLQEEYSLLDKKCKEQFEKLKKFAANIKKKALQCTELEAQVSDMKNKLSERVNKCEELSLAKQKLQQDLHIINSQYHLVQSEIQQSSTTQKDLNSLEQQNLEIQNQLAELQSQYANALAQIDSQMLHKQELSSSNDSLLAQLSEKETKIIQIVIENNDLSTKVSDYEKQIENTQIALSKIEILEHQIHEKQQEVTNWMEKLDDVKTSYDNLKCGHDAKIQERDLYIENLQAEILKHTDRITRLEDSVSTMEERRSSLERKTDHLVTKLNEKDAACSESSIHEDELEKRLTALIVHDELVQKQLKDTQNQNEEHHKKVGILSETNKSLKSELDSARSIINTLKTEISNLHIVEEERSQASDRVVHLENDLKRLSTEYSDILKNKTKEFEYMESDLHSQISNYETQRRISKDQYDRLHDEVLAQAQNFKDLQMEYDLLKGEHEHVLLKLEEAIQPKSIQPSNLQEKLNELSFILKEKDTEINRLRSIQDEHSKTVNVPSEVQLKNYFGDTTQDVDIQDKNREIEKLDNQFKMCFSQLSEAVEAEKQLKETCAQLTNSINEKDLIINQLQSELKQSNLLNQSLPQQVLLPKEVETEIIQSHVQKSLSANIEQPAFGSSHQLDAEALKHLQDQIIPPDHLIDDGSPGLDKHMIRTFEHDPPEPVQAEREVPPINTIPVVEDIIKPKTAYLCHTDEVFKHDTEEEDGWGWGGQDVVIEDQYVESTSSQNMAISDSGMIRDLQSRIEYLTAENNRMSSELTQSQQKVTKALIKLKEFKSKNEILNKELKKLKSSSDFNMLDMTIQDELSSQIKKLEEKNKEIISDMNKDKLEKDNLLKRIDVLSSANERLMEMKERQDAEMNICITNNKSLKDRIKNLEWDSNFSDEPDAIEPKVEFTSKTESKVTVGTSAGDVQIIELNKKIQELEADNEELQAFIEEQQSSINKSKSLELDLEKLKIQRSNEHIEMKSENDSLKVKLSEFSERFNETNHEIENLRTQESLQLLEIKSTNDDLNKKLKEITEHCEHLESEIKTSKVQSLGSAEISNENSNLRTNLEKLSKTNATIKINFENTLKENLELKTELEHSLKSKNQKEYFVVENTELKEKLEALVKEYYEFQEKFNEMASQKDKIELELSSIFKEKENLQIINKDLTAQEAACKAELIKLSYENEELAEKYDNLLKKLNDKNISDETKQIIRFTDQIHNLSQELDAKNTELIALNKNINSYETDKNSLQDNIDKLNTENAALLSNLAELRNNVTDAIDQRGAEVAEMWKQHLAMREEEFANSEQSFEEEKVILETQLSNSNDLYAETSKALEETKRQLEIITDEKNRFQSLYEINPTKELIKEESLLTSTELNENIIQEKELFLLNQELQHLRPVSEKLIEYERIMSIKDKSLEETILRMKQFEDNFNRKVYEYDLIINNKDSDYEQIRQQLYETENKFSDATHENEAELAGMRLKFHEERTSYENTISELRGQVEALEIQLETKINECKCMNIKLEELQVQVNEANYQLPGVRKVLEAQEMEIVTLKENLASQTDAYDQLAISHLQENYKNKTDRHVTFSEDTKPGAEIPPAKSSISPDVYEKTPRADLDLALYMLHQRDVRCEELTVELMQLLEERDTLQLKLSNAIRASEELRCKRSMSQPRTSESDTAGDAPKTEGIITGLESSSGLSQPQSSKDRHSEDRSIESPVDAKSLQTKLSQLHKVGHTRDIRLRDESEHRNRQMELLQRDVQNLPPEAAARLREAHFTLTRDTQSASTVLLNWLWGKTTPKVVHM